MKKEMEMKFTQSTLCFVSMVIVAISEAAIAAISIDPIARTFTKTGGAATVLTSGSGTWTASTASDWISIKPRTTGDAGVSCVYVVSKNMSTDTRVGQVVIDGNIHTVTQTGYDATLDTNEVTAGMDGTTGEVTITVDAGISWTIANDVDWISFDVTSGMGTHTVHYTIVPYAGIVTRTASIRIAGQNFVVAQTGKDVELTPASAYVESDAGIIEIRVTALETTHWNVSADAEWVYVVEGATGSGDSTLIISYAANESFKDRATTVSIGSAVFMLKQKGVDKVQVNLSQYEVTANPSGAYGIIGVTATPDGPWSAKSLSSWLTISGYAGEGNGTVEYVASPNLTLEPRTGAIEVIPHIRTPNPDIYAGLLVEFELIQIDGGSGYNSYASRTGSGHVWRRDYEHGWRWYGMGGDNLTLGENGVFSYATSFQVNAIDQLNRLFMIGNHSFYYDDANCLCLDASTSPIASAISTNTWHTILVEQHANGSVKVFDGKRGDSLALKLDLKGIDIFNGASLVMATNFVINTTKYPSQGSLDGKCEYQRIWNRVLSEEELPYVDLIDVGLTDKPYMFTCSADYPISSPSGFSSPSDGLCIYFPLDGNAYASINGYGAFSWGNISTSHAVTNRYGLPNRAICASAITIPKAATGYSNQSSLNYGGAQVISFWMKFSEYPDTTKSIVQMSGTDCLEITPQGILYLRASSEVGDFNRCSEIIPLDKWTMLTFVDSASSATGSRLYLNGHEVARGYFRISSNSINISARGGAVDDLYLIRSLLSSAQILELYENTKPVKKLYTVNQGIIEPALTPNQMQVAVEGGTEVVSLTMGPGVAWAAESNVDWLTIPSGASGSGSVSISVNVAANPRAESRVGTITVAGLTLTVRQEPLWSEVENDTPLPPAEDGGYGIITVTTEGNAAWKAVSDASWLTIIDDGDHYGTDSIMWAADPYTDTTRSRTGTIKVADHFVHITQRGYELSVEPRGKTASSSGETGQIYVNADSEVDIWDVIATEPWITITSGATGAGSKTVTYTLSDNTSGATRTGSILIGGIEYVITQTAKVNLNATAVGHGTITGVGEYEANATAQLTAIADSGYVFSSWGGDVFGVTTNITVTMDRTKAVTATFIPESAAQQIAKDRGAQGEGLYTRDQIHALEMGDLVLDVDSASGTARVGVRLMESSDLSNPDGWTPVGLSHGDIDIGADGTVGLNVEAKGNAKFFKVVVQEK